MKVQFGNYTFFDALSDDKGTYQGTNDAYKSKAFNDAYFNNLISTRRYADAADYAAQYHFNDPEVQKAHENDIINLRRNGRVLGAIYGRIQDDDTLKKIEFFDSALSDGGLEKLNVTNTKDPTYNTYADQFIKAKEELGNEMENTGWFPDVKKDGRKATGLTVHFAPTKRKFLGIDWLAADNDNSIEEFYNTSGLSEQDLKKAGVDVIHKDGATSLKFDKSNPLANKILYNIPEHMSLQGPLSPLGNGNVPVNVTGYDDKGDISYGKKNVSELKSLISEAKAAKEEVFSKLNLEHRDYSSTIGPILSDELSALKQSLASGEITETQYNQQAKALAPHVFSAIYSLGSGNYQMYSNKYNEDTTDETLVPMGNKERGELVDLINNYAPKDIDVSAMVSNGKIGTLITLKGTGNETASDKNDGHRVQIFVPGLLQEEAQQKINRNTSTRAVQELNSMIDWGYDYKLRDGSSVSVNGKGEFLKDDKVIDKESAIREINKDMIMEDAISNLKFQYMNSDGNIIDNIKYEQMSKLLSMNAVQDIYQDIHLNINPQTLDVTITDKYGNVHNPDDIFDRKVSRENTQYEVYNRLEEIYAMYNELMNELNYYK